MNGGADAVTDSQLQLILQIVTALIALVGAVGAAFAAYRGGQNTTAIEKGQVQQRRQERKVDDLTTTMDDNTQVTQAVHTLVNSEHGVALDTAALALRQVADLTTGTAAKAVAVAAAENAERKYADHQAQQAAVDADPPPVPKESPR